MLCKLKYVYNTSILIGNIIGKNLSPERILEKIDSGLMTPGHQSIVTVPYGSTKVANMEQNCSTKVQIMCMHSTSCYVCQIDTFNVHS